MGIAVSLALCVLLIGLVSVPCRAGEGLAGEPCVAGVELVPPRAVVGQQVLHRIRIERSAAVVRTSWLRPPAFPDFRAEALPGRPEQRASDGARLVRIERRALFPARTGALEIPGPRLRCLLATSPGDPRGGDASFDVELPTLVLQVDPLPQAGRPAGFEGLVGPVRLWAALSPERVRLGETAHVSIGLDGGANVWDAVLPALVGETAGEPSHAEVFPRRGDVGFEPGERLRARRLERFDVVPRRIGPLRFPLLRVAYYDPERRSYAFAEASLPVLEVLAPAKPVAATEGPAASSAGAPHAPLADGGASRTRGRPLLPSVLLGLLCAVGIALPLAIRRHQRSAPLREALAEADRALERGDRRGEAAALDRALRFALERRARAGVAAVELAARAGEDERLRELAGLCEALARARFGAAEADTSATAAARAWLDRNAAG